MKQKYHKSVFRVPLMMLVALLLILVLSSLALAENAISADVKPEDVFLKMPTSADLSKPYDGKQPAWVDFAYDISGEASLWVNDTSHGADGLGLVYLDIYRLNEATGQYEEFHVGRYPGNMGGADSPGLEGQEAGFFNYGPPYGESYYSVKTVGVGQYKAVWWVPIYGTNAANFNIYEYVSYETEFEITPPGIFTAVPELTRDANGTPIAAPEPAFDLSLIDYSGDAAAAQATEYWYVYDAEAEQFAGEALAAAPAEIGKYVYRLQVSDGDKLDENLYIVFELTDPNPPAEPFWRILGRDMAIFDVPPTDPSKVYDGQPVTFDDMGITYDVTRVGKSSENEWYELIWYEPNQYGAFTWSIGELQGSRTGPSAPGTYNFQFGVHGDDDLEGFIYVKFTIHEADEAAPAALPFTDVVSGSAYYDAVAYVYENGLYTGISATQFAPEAAMTEAMLATVLWRMAGAPAVAATDDSWYGQALVWAAESGVLTVEQVGQAVSYGQVAEALFACAKAAGYAVEGDDAQAWAVAARLFQDQAGEDFSAPASRAAVAAALMHFAEQFGQ